jgi:hypothetical protein
MRTTLTLDDDIFALARTLAQREGISLGEMISRLVRQGVQSQQQSIPLRKKTKSRFALLPVRDENISVEHLRSLMDQKAYELPVDCLKLPECAVDSPKSL